MVQVSMRGEELMPTIAETWVEQGLQQGRLVAERQLLKRLARQRFGDEVERRAGFVGG